MNKRFTPIWFLVAVATCLMMSSTAMAQLTTPRASPTATVSEDIGITTVKIKYARPAVNEREIWGQLVPYGLTSPFPGFGSGNAFPWRAGANENTVISFEHDVLVEGEALAAGAYGLHMIPGESEWTVIFSENTSSWGSFFYDEAEDALRVTVTPEEAPFQERLVYEFMEQDGNGAATIAVVWENLKVPFRVEVDQYHDVVMASMRDELRSTGGFNWQGWFQAGNYAHQNQINQEEALGWAEQAIARDENFNTLKLKADLLTQLDRGDEAEPIMAEAIEVASENQLNAYGYQLMGQDQLEEALEIFKLNVERHPDAWNPHDSLGEAYANAGDTEQALKYYKMALDKLPEGDQANHDRITGILADLDSAGQ